MEIQLWREILSPYEQAVTELVEKFQHLSLEHSEQRDKQIFSCLC